MCGQKGMMCDSVVRKEWSVCVWSERSDVCTCGQKGMMCASVARKEWCVTVWSDRNDVWKVWSERNGVCKCVVLKEWCVTVWSQRNDVWKVWSERNDVWQCGQEGMMWESVVRKEWCVCACGQKGMMCDNVVRKKWCVKSVVRKEWCETVWPERNDVWKVWSERDDVWQWSQKGMMCARHDVCTYVECDIQHMHKQDSLTNQDDFKGQACTPPLTFPFFSAVQELYGIKVYNRLFCDGGLSHFLSLLRYRNCTVSKPIIVFSATEGSQGTWHLWTAPCPNIY